MELKDFEYFEPRTIEQAISLLKEYKEKAKVVAGGTDLIVQMKLKEITPQYLVNLKTIPHLDYIDYHPKEGLRIGALTTLHALEISSVINERFPILGQAAHTIGSVQIRNLGTLGGNLCHAAPSADTAPALMGLGARVGMISSQGERTIALEDFFTGPGKTVLQSDEILTEIQIPNPPPHTGGIYIKHSVRSAMDLAIVGVAVVITLDPPNRVCRDVKITLGAVAPTPIRAHQAEGILRGKTAEDRLVEEAAQMASQQTRSISDIRGSAEYRREMVKVLTGRAVRRALELARGA